MSATPSSIGSLQGLRAFYGRLVCALAGLLMALVSLPLLLGLGTIALIAVGLVRDGPDLAMGLLIAFAIPIFLYVAPAACLAYLFLPGSLAVVLALPAALLWHRPARLLVLRKFGRNDRSLALQSVLRRRVAPLGHVYTLSDRDIRVPAHIRYPVVFAQLAFFHFRRRVIRSERSMQRVVAAMNLRWARSLNWFVSGGRTFAVDATDESWERGMLAMAECSDAILIDLSNPSENIATEVRHMIACGYLQRTVFLTLAAKRAESTLYLAALGVPTDDSLRLVEYDRDGGSALTPAVADAIEAGEECALRPRAPLSTWLATLGQMIGPITWTTLAVLLALGEWRERHHPTTVRSFARRITAPETRGDGLAQLRSRIEGANEGPAPSGFRRFADMYLQFVEPGTDRASLPIDEAWLHEYDALLVPVLAEHVGESQDVDVALLEIADAAGRLSAAPLWDAMLARVLAEAQPQWQTIELALQGMRTAIARERSGAGNGEGSDAWRAFDEQLIPRLQTLCQDPRSSSHVVLQILKEAARPSAVPIWVAVIDEAYAGDRNGAALLALEGVRCARALGALDAIVRLLHRVGRSAARSDPGTALRVEALETLASLRSSRADAVVLANLAAHPLDRGALDAPAPSSVTSALRAWTDGNNDRETVLRALRNASHPAGSPVWKEVLGTRAAHATDAERLLALGGIGAARAVDLVELVVDAVEVGARSDIADGGRRLLMSEAIAALGELRVDSTAPLLYALVRGDSSLPDDLRRAASRALGWNPAPPTEAPTKPHVRVGTIGQVDHGTTTLTTAILETAETERSDPSKPEVWQSAGTQRPRRVLLSTQRVEYETPTRHYTHFGCPDHPDLVKGVITGATQLDGAILVVAADEGPGPRTRECVRLARQAGVPSMVVFLDKCDLQPDPGLLDLFELEVRELLGKHGYPGDELPVIRGSALLATQRAAAGRDDPHGACILELLDAMDRWIAVPRPDDEPLLFVPTRQVEVGGGRRLVAGRIERGTVRPGNRVELVGLGGTSTATVSDVVAFGRVEPEGSSGELGGLVFDPTGAGLVDGQVVAAPGSIAAASRFEALIYLLDKSEGGRHTPVFDSWRPDFYFWTVDVPGRIQLLASAEMLMPGDVAEVEVTLESPVAIEEQLRFAIREGSRTLGCGIVTRLPD